jgi:DNA-binding beta-propeller fold protein YncE
MWVGRPTASGAVPATVISGSADHFNNPSGISSDDTHVWVANSKGHYVTELSAATGALVQSITGPRHGFNQPTAVSSEGTDVWVTNPGDESVTGFPASSG